MPCSVVVPLLEMECIITSWRLADWFIPLFCAGSGRKCLEVPDEVMQTDPQPQGGRQSNLDPYFLLLWNSRDASIMLLLGSFPSRLRPDVSLLSFSTAAAAYMFPLYAPRLCLLPSFSLGYSSSMWQTSHTHTVASW